MTQRILRARYAIPLLILVALWTPMVVLAQQTDSAPKTYPDGRGGEITLPMGDISFADRVVRFEEGTPRTSHDDNRDPQAILGPPDYDTGVEIDDLTLGCNGSIVVEFVDNALVDIPGIDLHVWEVGPDVESTNLAISKNGTDWIEVGEISGGTASVDIAGHVEAGDTFRFARLTDVGCSGSTWPGADVDAVAAVGSAERVVFDSAVLFAFDEATLTPEAQEVLRSFGGRFSDQSVSTLRIEGHTDSKGSAEYNLDLSQRRADAVHAFLQTLPTLSDSAMETRGAGLTEPVADNDTEEGRQKNRRVEIIVIP